MNAPVSKSKDGAWTLAKAKDSLSEVVRRAAEQGPQVISVRGEDAAVVLSKADYDRLRDPNRPKDFKEFLLSIPPLDELDLERTDNRHREVDL